MNFDLIAVGSPIMDSLVNVSEEFVQSIEGDKGGMELVDSDYIESLINKVDSEVFSVPGGSAANAIFAGTKLGLQTAVLGKIGSNEVAEDYVHKYLAIGGDDTLFKTSPSAHGHCLSMITPDKQRTMRTSLGAAMELSKDDVSVEDFLRVKYVHVEGYMLFNPDLLLHCLACAKEAGCTISLDLASFEVVNACKEILAEILENYINIVFANEDEAIAFTGVDNDYAKMAKILTKNCDIAVVKMGADGAYVADKDSLVKIDAEKVDTVLDTTGAGDAFAGGFLFGQINGHDLEESAQIGAMLGAEVVQVIGATIPTERWDVIEEKLEDFGE